jgi:hypothetical protein
VQIVGVLLLGKAVVRSNDSGTILWGRTQLPNIRAITTTGSSSRLFQRRFQFRIVRTAPGEALIVRSSISTSRCFWCRARLFLADNGYQIVPGTKGNLAEGLQRSVKGMLLRVGVESPEDFRGSRLLEFDRCNESEDGVPVIFDELSVDIV